MTVTVFMMIFIYDELRRYISSVHKKKVQWSQNCQSKHEKSVINQQFYIRYDVKELCKYLIYTSQCF